VARKLVALRVDGGVPVGGARLLSGDRQIGVVTSAAQSPRFGAIALGYVHRDFVAPGTALRVDDLPPEGGSHAAVVSERPIPSAA
jgi:glycine cleavage system aminomethyltransferase T